MDIPVAVAHEAHGGGDTRMLDALFGGSRPGGHPAADGDSPAEGHSSAYGHPTATERDGALALAVGLAANRCFETGRPVRVRELVPGLGEQAP